MVKKRIGKTELRSLRTSPYVDRILGNRVYFSEEFQDHFIEEYKNGKSPSQIFLEAGLDPSKLGSKRIERCAARWREKYGVEVNRKTK